MYIKWKRFPYLIILKSFMTVGENNMIYNIQKLKMSWNKKVIIALGIDL